MASVNSAASSARIIHVEGSSAIALPDDLSSFYKRFKSDNTTQLQSLSQTTLYSSSTH